MSETVSVCARCAAEGLTCCQKTQVFVTGGDIVRARNATGRNDFYENALPSDPGYVPDAGTDPAWAGIFAADGSRRVLRHGRGGDCLFLGEKGCALGIGDRPLVCRLYPFDYTHERLGDADAHLCPADCRNDPVLALGLLGMDRREAEGWRRRLYEEIEAEFPS